MPYTMEDFRREHMPEILQTIKRNISAEQLASLFPAEEFLKNYNPEERLQGLKPEERLQGLKPEDVLLGMKPDVVEAIKKLLSK
jgi:hypothetical protein